MIITAIKETFAYERRVAITPDSTKKILGLGHSVIIEKDAGLEAGFDNEAYRQAGAEIADDAATAVKNAEVLFKIQAPSPEELQRFPDGLTIIGDFRYFSQNDEIITRKRLSIFALERIPRLSRAQNMDILSSQDNLAGYKAVLEAVNMLNRAVPMMTTAAGSVPPTKVLIIGVGVAGLQAIATAKRLGAMVYASDIRLEAKEQAESLNARFIPTEEVNNLLAEMNIIITAAGSPPKAPKLLHAEDIAHLSRGSVLIDISGNVQNLDSPQTYTTENGAIVSGDNLLPALLSQTSSRLFSNNIFNFFQLLHPDNIPGKGPDFLDEVIRKTCLFYQGKKQE